MKITLPIKKTIVEESSIDIDIPCYVKTSGTNFFYHVISNESRGCVQVFSSKLCPDLTSIGVVGHLSAFSGDFEQITKEEYDTAFANALSVLQTSKPYKINLNKKP